MGLLTQDFEQRTLRKNHRSSMPTRMLFLDVETKPSRKGRVDYHSFRLGWSVFWERRPARGKDTEIWKFWDRSYPFMRYIESLCIEKKTLYLFAHNAFFDLQSSEFFLWFTKWGWVLDFVYESGTTYLLVIRKGKMSIKVISTTNYFNASVKELGDLLVIPKIDCDPLAASDEELKVYCRRDVEIIFQAMRYYLEFIEVNDLGKFSLTKSSQAFNAYRHRFMNTKISIHASDEVKELERAAYMGGRVECFRLGEQKDGPFVSLDINSMYPYIMRNMEFPVRLRSYFEGLDLDKAKMIVKKSLVVAEIEVETEEPCYAVKVKDKVVYPVGSFRCFVNTPGFKYALERGHLKRILRLASYDKGCLFKGYVDFFYSLRQRYQKEGNAIMAVLAKYLLNTLYGKFAQKVSLTDEKEERTCEGYYRIDNYDIVTGEKWVTYKLMNKVVTEQGKGEGRNALVAIASHITEYSRFYLWEIMRSAGVENVIYCDTDSIRLPECFATNLKRYIDPKKLGRLKVEERFSQFTVWGPKSYETEHGRKMKGVPRKAESIGPLSWRYPSFLKQKSHLRASEQKHFMVRIVDKTITGAYDKGIVLSDGRIIPFRFSLPQPPSSLPLVPSA